MTIASAAVRIGGYTRPRVSQEQGLVQPAREQIPVAITKRLPRAPARRALVPRVPCVLAIGGLDPGGGAGVLADARAIAKAGAFACAAVAVLTVQSTSGMRSATPVATREVLAECTEVLKNQRVAAIKIGALGSEENVRGIGDFLAIHRSIPAVVDTVMVPTRGRARLLEERAVTALRERILPRAALVTVNAPEAEILTGRRVTRIDEAHEAALELLRLGCQAVLLKGGHLGGPLAVDLLAIPREGARNKTATASVIELSAPRLALAPTHGGGCALASLIAARLAMSDEPYPLDPRGALESAVRWAKDVHHEALLHVTDVGGDLRVLFA
jgi:hydroxymethylpyrimidine/phosphomethylpyrimidine kinase